MSATPTLSRRIVLTTLGSLGDLHPYLAVALGLRERGHVPLIATHAVYREKIESEGIAFAPVAPDLPDVGDEKEFTRRAFASVGGIEYLVKTLIVEPFPRTFADLQTATTAHHADIIIGHPLTFAARMVAELAGLPWLSVALAPASFQSAHDPFVFPQAAFISRLQPLLGAKNYGNLMKLLIKTASGMTKPVRDFRLTVGLPRADDDPLFDGQWSPHGTLALFSSALGVPQPDWHPKTVQTGFCFYDKLAAGNGLPSELAAFLDAGAAPIVFTLGSAAVNDAGAFYEVSAQAAAILGKRAVLLTGRGAENVPQNLPGGIIAVPYAPYSELFPRCAVLVHQGGVGTTGQSLRAGRPQLIVPHGFDQPDNAHRMAVRGVGRTVAKKRYNVPTVARELAALLGNPSYAEQAAKLGAAVRGEHGVDAACAAIEQVLQETAPVIR